MSQIEQYQVPQYLNQPYTFGGFPLDEVIPMGLLGLLAFILVSNKLLAIAFPLGGFCWYVS